MLSDAQTGIALSQAVLTHAPSISGDKSTDSSIGQTGDALLYTKILKNNVHNLSNAFDESQAASLWNNDDSGNQLLDLKSDAFPYRTVNRCYYSARQITFTNPKKEVSDPTLLMHDGNANALIVEDLKRRMLGDNPKQIRASARWWPISQKLYGRPINIKDGPFLAAVLKWVHLGGNSTVSTPTLPDFKGYLESVGIEFGRLGPVHPKTPANELYYNEKNGILEIHATLADFELIDAIIR